MVLVLFIMFIVVPVATHIDMAYPKHIALIE